MRVVAAFAAGGLWALDGALTAGAWQRKELNVDPGEANTRRKIALKLETRRRHWAHGGATTLANMCLGCDRHHDHWHRHHLMPVRQTDGTWILPPYPQRTLSPSALG